MPEIKAIETHYNGYRFRSRAEARWAVFFDAIGMRYQYEPEGYKLANSVYYLPDFYLPDAGQFFEVKGDLSHISWEEREKAILLANAAGKCVIVGDGNFELTGFIPHGFPCSAHFIENALECLPFLGECCSCGTLYFVLEMGFTCPSCGELASIPLGSSWSKNDWFANKRYIDAITKARQARFEHGETPKI